MPLTLFQKEIARLLACTKSESAYLAGGAALHQLPNSVRYSNDLDYFCDSESRVAECYAADCQMLERHGYSVSNEMVLPGYVRAIVKKADESTKIEWARDTAWRFMPAQKSEDIGYCLHPVDLAINKVLALVGRDEPRDFFDVLHAHASILPLGAMCWAAAGKDPGFTPFSLLELLKRRGTYHARDFQRLKLETEFNLPQMKQTWLTALHWAELFIYWRPPEETGCLYWDPKKETFYAPAEGACAITHYGRPGGILPQID